jgi:hypothetical protein
VNAVRVGIQNGKIKIHPRCKKLIAHLESGVWKSRKSKRLEFDRPNTDVFADGERIPLGHYDFVAALVYFELSVQKHRNPTPAVEKRIAGDLKISRQDPKARRTSEFERKQRRRAERARQKATA